MSRGRCGCEIAQLRRLVAMVAASSCDFEVTLKIASGWRFLCGRRSKKRCDFCSGMVASPLAATVVTAILRCDFCAAKFTRLRGMAPNFTRKSVCEDSPSDFCTGKSHPWTNASLGGDLWRTFMAIGPYRFSLKTRQQGIGPKNLPWNSFGPMGPKSFWKFWSTLVSVHRLPPPPGDPFTKISPRISALGKFFWRLFNSSN